MGYFKAPRPARKAAKPTERRPRDWRRQTHVCILAGTRDWDGVGICAECDHRADHKIHDLNDSYSEEAAEIEARRLGEGGVRDGDM